MTLAAPLARALDEPDDTLTRGPWDNGAYARRVCERLRNDPETLAALAEALVAWRGDMNADGDDFAEAAALADALFGAP